MIDLLFARRCCFCDAFVTKEERGICTACWENAQQEMQTVICMPPAGIEHVVCAGWYRDRLKYLLWLMKFKRRGSWLLEPMSRLAEGAWEQSSIPQPDLITCVPLTPTRDHMRGFNQSEEIARRLADRKQIPYQRTLKRKPFAKRQSRLKASERWENARNTFYLRKDTRLNGETVLLVDDIVTTGATVHRCAALLREAGAGRVYVLAVAKAGKSRSVPVEEK